MKTQILQVDDVSIQLAAKGIVDGKTVAYPTDTVYGLGANALNEEAVKKVYSAKGRQITKPLIVCVADKAMFKRVVQKITPTASKLIDLFLPGALTLVLPKSDIVPSVVTAGGANIAVRIPKSDIALKLIRYAGVPITAPSANTSSKPSPTLAKHVQDDLNGKIDYILDGGACDIGIESTVIDLTGKPRMLRSGGVDLEAIEKVVGKVEVERHETNYAKQYAPKASVYFSAFYDEMHHTICDRYDMLSMRGQTPVILCVSDRNKLYGKRNYYDMGDSYDDYAHNLFAALRRADDDGYNAVIAEGIPAGGIGDTLINRLIRSSGGQII